ncbi:hypothetical protein [Dyadobacter jejuensis]|nr:hypothetical protein [Dyadobacter jejuensis]
MAYCLSLTAFKKSIVSTGGAEYKAIGFQQSAVGIGQAYGLLPIAYRI